MRSVVVPSALLTLVLAFVLASPAWAGEPAKLPVWGGEDVILRAEALPEGWSVVEGDAAIAGGKSMEQVAAELAKKDEIDDLDLAYAAVTVKDAAGAEVTLLLVDVDADPKGLPKALAEAAKSKGWTYAELGTPLRMLVAQGPEEARAKAIAAQRELAVLVLANRGFQRYQQAANVPPTQRVPALESALSLAQSAAAIDPELSAPWVVVGLAATGLAQARDDAARYDVAIEAFRKAFREGAKNPPPGALAYQGMSEFGLALLMKKTPEANQEAKVVLLRSIDLEKFDERGALKGITRYNLACALSLLGEKADAIKHLEQGLMAQKAATTPAEFAKFLNEHVPQDKDLDGIRGEPEFAEMLKRVAGGGSAGSSGI